MIAIVFPTEKIIVDPFHSRDSIPTQFPFALISLLKLCVKALLLSWYVEHQESMTT